MANPKSVVDGKCPYCGSEEGFTERWVQNMCQYYSFDGKPIECNSHSVRGGTKQYCAECERVIHIPNLENVKGIS